MLSRTRSTFNFNFNFGHDHECSHEKSSFDLVGLRHIVENLADVSDVGIKPVFILSEPTAPVVIQESNNFLKACGLCRKKLSPQKDVYMYRGDESFCSDHCRGRKILIEELLEMETPTKEILGNARRCPTTDVQINVPGCRRGVQAGGS